MHTAFSKYWIRRNDLDKRHKSELRLPNLRSVKCRNLKMNVVFTFGHKPSHCWCPAFCRWLLILSHLHFLKHISDGSWHSFQWKEPFAPKKGYGLGSLGSKHKSCMVFFLLLHSMQEQLASRSISEPFCSSLYLKKIKKPHTFPLLFLYQILMSAHSRTSASMVLVITSLDFSDASVKWATSWTEAVETAQVKIILNNMLLNFLLCCGQLLRRFF